MRTRQGTRKELQSKRSSSPKKTTSLANARKKSTCSVEVSPDKEAEEVEFDDIPDELLNILDNGRPTAPGRNESFNDCIPNVSSALADITSFKMTEGIAMAQGATVNSAGYEKRKLNVLLRFVKDLSHVKKYEKYFETVDNESVPATAPYRPVEVIFLMLSDCENDRQAKIAFLSEMLVDWVNSVRVVPKGNKAKEAIKVDLDDPMLWPTPSTITTDFKTHEKYPPSREKTSLIKFPLLPLVKEK